jgi:hypothetical protein
MQGHIVEFRLEEFIITRNLNRTPFAFRTAPSIMLFAHAAVFLSIFVEFAQVRAIPQASKKCQTIDSGFLSTFIGSTLLASTMTGWVLNLIFKPITAATRR